jgi:membrane protease YdiL (CAAX protease family)
VCQVQQVTEPSSSRAPSPREAVSIAFAVTIGAGAVLTFAFDPARAGQGAMIASIGGLYALLSLVGLVRLSRRGELRERLRPMSGDISIAAVTAGALYGGGRIVQMLAAGHGSPREAWVVRLYLQIGDTEAAGRGMVGAAVFAIAALEEITWRGLAQRTLEDAFGPRRALIYATLLYGLAHAPTVWLLRDPRAGLNPLLLLAALGCGLVWGGIVVRTGRLFPAVVAHALFSWAMIEFPLWQVLRM